MKNLFVIPTHRYVMPAVLSVMKEMKVVGRKSNEACTLLVVDNGNELISRTNKKELLSLTQTTGVQIVHMDLSEQTQFLSELSIKSNIQPEIIHELLYPEGVDYGKIFNMIYLLAVRMGANTIHRRDSDCFANEAGKYGFPAMHESQLMGEYVDEIHDQLWFTEQVEEDYAAKFHEQALIVGGDYQGNWNLNLEGLQKRNPGALTALYEAQGIPEQSIAEYIRIKFVEQDIEIAPKPILITGSQAGAYPDSVPYYPECGSIAMQEVFKWIPNFIGSYGIGYDYHTYVMSCYMHVPAIYHPAKIIHKHEKGRGECNEIMQLYWKGIIKCADFNGFLTILLNDHVEVLLATASTGIDRLREIATSQLPDALDACMLSMVDQERVDRIDYIADRVLIPAGDELSLGLAQFLKKQKHEIIREIDQDYRRSISLQRHWRSMIEAAECMYRAYQEPSLIKEVGIDSYG